MHPTVAANRQHALDAALGIWKPRGRGSRRVHENYDGWTIGKTPDGYRWQVTDPQGRPWSSARYPVARLGRETWHNLTFAKLAVDEHLRPA